MFEGQRPSEKIIFILLKHPAVLFRPLLWLSLLSLLPVFAFIYFKFSWVFSYACFFWLLFGGGYGLRAWYCFKESQYILTDERLIRIEQKSFFHKLVMEADLSKIQDVSYEVRGFWSSMLDFGNVEVHIYPPAGAKMVLGQVEEPKKIQQQILNIIPRSNEVIENVQAKESREGRPKAKKQDLKEDIKKPAAKESFWD